MARVDRRPAIDGLYALTPDLSDTAELLRRARLALQGGARVLQYRCKLPEAALRQQQAQALRQLTREFGATYIVNDDAQLAAAVEADGVHLGAEDGAIEAARGLLGTDRIIGASCYNQLALAQAAAAQGADYVAFGAFFSSSTKPGAVVAPPELLREAEPLGVPRVAIGGITPANAAQLVAAGADALAVITALFDAADIEATARNFAKLYSRNNAT